MLNKIASIIFLFIFTVNIFSLNGNCVSATEEDSNRFGGNDVVTIVGTTEYKSIRGTVYDHPGDQLEDVLVEVFDRLDWIKENKSSPPDNQKRLYASVTKKGGRFSFPKLSKGDYEVRFSKAEDWSPT